MSTRLPALLIVVSVAASSGTALARVTVKGKVEFWNQLENRYQPAQQVHVEVEGDWYWRSDPDVLTNDEGDYSASVGDPPWWWDNYDGVDIEVYAEKTNHFEVYDSWYSWWPYHAISKEKNNVRGGATVVIDLKIGGPQDNVGEAYYRSKTETANAFVIIQKMLEQKSKLQSFGWTKDDFDEVEVIVPAVGETSYYDNVTGYINLVMDSAGWSGTGNWKTLTTNVSVLADINYFYETVQHEFAHNIHDEMTGVRLPDGLLMPSHHSPLVETNRWIAFTEGLAEFLPLVSNGIGTGRNALELSRKPPSYGTASNPNPKWVDMPESGNHSAMEGEVAAVFWDIFDDNQWEIYRKTVSKTENGNHALPANFNKNLRWRDSVSDPKLMKIRATLKSQGGDGPVETLAEFLRNYTAKYPAETHGIKAIAHNRSIRYGVPTQRAPYLANGPSYKRLGPKLQFKVRAVEADQEDQAALRVVVMLGDGHLYPIQVKKKTWQNAVCELEFDVNLNNTWVEYYDKHPEKKLWLVLTDDIDLKVYQFDWVRNLMVATLDIAKDETTVSSSFVGVVPLPIPVAQVSLPSEPAIAAPARPDVQTLTRIRRDFDALKAERRQLGELHRKQVRLERALYKFARRKSLMKGSLSADTVVQTRRQLANRHVNPQVQDAARELGALKDKLVRGQLDTSTLKPEEKNALMQLKNQLVASEGTRTSLDKRIKQRLSTLSSAVNSPKIPSTYKPVNALRKVLKTADADFKKATDDLTIERFQGPVKPTSTVQPPRRAPLPRKRLPLR